MGFKFDGSFDNLEKLLRQAENEMGDKAQEVLGDNIQEVFDETQRRVPKKTGMLKESGQIVWKDRSGPTRSASIVYGNSEVDRVGVFYAAAVHEILDAEHAPPTGPKYVELPLIEQEDKFKRDLKRAAAKALGKKTL
ncbi:hypothetical protein [Streptomyces sp. NPDC006477]|uniref:hypothetical protein n=1 Tax=Streptomyces sp. NPDC006477 TaxID=3364747 RepID=UPI0036C16FE0